MPFSATTYNYKNSNGQSYKDFTIVNYDSRLVQTRKLPIPTSLEPKFTSIKCFKGLTTGFYQLGL